MADIAALEERIVKLEHELAIQQDIHQIRRIQYTYGYFIDKSQYNEVVDLFFDQGDVWFLGGIYKGNAGVRRLYPQDPGFDLRTGFEKTRRESYRRQRLGLKAP